MRITPKEEPKNKKKRQKGIRPNTVLNPENLIIKLNKNTVRLNTVGIIQLSEKQIKMIIANVKKSMKREGVINVPLLADHPISKKPLEIRMGKGKGAVSHHSVKVNPGNLLVEIKVHKKEFLIKAINTLKELQKKLPILTLLDII